MSPESLFAILSEPISGRVHDDLIIAALECYRFPRGMGSCAGEGIHVGLCYEFDWDGDVEFPCSEGFVVGGCDEAAVFVYEGDGVDGA